MTTETKILRRIEALPEPRHIFILPDWADPAALEKLIRTGHIACDHVRRNKQGAIQRVMKVELTLRGHEVAYPDEGWPILALKGSLAGMGLTAMSLLILYLA